MATPGNLLAIGTSDGTKHNAVDSNKKPADFETAGAAAAVQSNLDSHTSNTSNPHGVTAAQAGAIATSARGAANGVASLDENVRIFISQLPEALAHNLGYFATQSALESAYPSASAGDFAIVGTTDTVWVWDADTEAWLDSGAGGAVVSVNGKTGVVILNATDVGAAASSHTHTTGDITDFPDDSWTVVTANHTAVAGEKLLVDVSAANSGLDEYTMLLLHCNGYFGQMYFADSAKRHTLSYYNNPILTDQQFKFGSTSLVFDGASYITIPDSEDWDFGTTPFCIDCWVRPTSATAYMMVLDRNSSPRGGVFFYNGSVFAYGKTFAWTPTINTWYHLAVTYDGTNLRCFIDGTQIGSNQALATAGSAATEFVIGGSYNYTTKSTFWLDELRISKGVSRWTENFTAPTAPYGNPGFTITLPASPVVGDKEILIADKNNGFSVTPVALDPNGKLIRGASNSILLDASGMTRVLYTGDTYGHEMYFERRS